MRNKKNISKKKPKKLVMYAVFLAILICISVVVAIQASTFGSEVAKLDDEGNALASNNMALRDKVLRNESLTNYQKKAEELGFVKPSDIVYVGKDKEVASIH